MSNDKPKTPEGFTSSFKVVDLKKYTTPKTVAVVAKPEPLKVTKTTMSSDGILTILFSKDVLWPKLNLAK